MTKLIHSTISFTLILVLATLFSCANEPKDVKLDSDMSKYSYAMGNYIAKNMVKAAGIPVDMNAFYMAINDIMKDKESKMDQQAIQAALASMQEVAMKAQQEKAQANVAKGAEFLEKNKQESGVSVTGSGLQYRVITSGNGPQPTLNNTVKVHYTGKLIDGTVFDSSVERGEPVEFPVSGVIPGWTEALQIMPVGSKWELVIPSELAYGERGSGAQIPGNSVLVFEVELLDIVQ